MEEEGETHARRRDAPLAPSSPYAPPDVFERNCRAHVGARLLKRLFRGIFLTPTLFDA